MIQVKGKQVMWLLRSARIGTQFREWSKHWQVGEGVQDQKAAREDQEPRCKEEALPLLNVKVLWRAAAACQVSTGIGVDGNASSTVFLLIPKVSPVSGR